MQTFIESTLLIVTGVLLGSVLAFNSTVLLANAQATQTPDQIVPEVVTPEPAENINTSPVEAQADIPELPKRLTGKTLNNSLILSDAIDIPPSLLSRFEPQKGDIVRQVNPGTVHIRRVTSDPLRINVLLFDLTAPEFDLKPAVGDNWLSGQTRPSFMARQKVALAAVNGDLFSGSGIPQGLTMIDSHVLIPPKHRATFAWGHDREPFIGYFTDSWTWQAEVIAANGQRHILNEFNRYCQNDWVCLFNEFGRGVPYIYGDVKVLIGPSGRVFNIIQESLYVVEPGWRMLQGVGDGADWLLENVSLGDTVQISKTTTMPLENYTQAISGGPIIVQDGKFKQDCMCLLFDCRWTGGDEIEGLLCEDFNTDWKESHYNWSYMPRTGVGYDKHKQTLIVAVVDGYQYGYSRGMLQAEFADLLIEFGAHTAMELDGGGSVTMVLREEVELPVWQTDTTSAGTEPETTYEYTILNNPSDSTGERHVANALLFFWNEEQPDQPFTQTVRPPALRPN